MAETQKLEINVTKAQLANLLAFKLEQIHKSSADKRNYVTLAAFVIKHVTTSTDLAAMLEDDLNG